MAENNYSSQKQPLLLQNSTKKSSVFHSLTKWVLKSLMWSLFLIWVCAIFFFCTGFANGLLQTWVQATENTLFGITGSIFLAFSAPILIIAFLAFIYVAAFPNEDFEEKKSKFPRFRLWTFPVLVDGPFGVVSAAEFIGIVLFIIYVLWTITYYIIQGLISESSLDFKEKSYFMLELIGVRLGSIGIFCMIFLFLPVSRGSILLRMIDIPFEHATRYHVWLGHLTMLIFTLHGLFYMIAWVLQGILIQKLLEWKEIGVANLPGVISLFAGLLMWVTSLQPVRKKHFELFFYTHQLYIIFVLFLALHVGDFVFSIVASSVFLFMMDRFLRLIQSRTKVDLISASCRPCGTIELTFAKPANLSYNALSFIFIQVRELSFFQWHPFSVSSSPLNGKYHVSVLIKVLGTWTDQLRQIITNYSDQSGRENHDSQRISAFVEGPYGHESPYHLMYENLILVAGGIGISPFIAILNDILHRIREGKSCLPKKVTIIWAIKKSNELSLLSIIDAQSICPSFDQKLDLDIQTYVTQQSEPSLEEGKIEQNISFPSIFMKTGTSMSSLVGTGNNIFAALYVILSTFGFIAIFGLVQVYYIDKFGIYQWWYKGLLFIGSMVLGVVLVGGIVVISWHLFERHQAKIEISTESCVDPVLNCEMGETTDIASLQTIRYGSRPNFEELFRVFSEKVGNADIGVIVCGPSGLQSSVAKECRSQNLKRGRKNHAIFHFHSHSFDL